MSISESVIQSQLALNAQVINMWEHSLEDIDTYYKEGIAEKIYCSGNKATKEYRKSLYAVWYAHRKPYKDKIAKYVKLQKALKAELREVRWGKPVIPNQSAWRWVHLP